MSPPDDEEEETPPAGLDLPPGVDPPPGVDLPESFLPTRKVRPAAPSPSPHLKSAELLDKADAIERSLRRPGWEKTDPGGFANNAYVKRKARRYTLLGVAGAVAISLLDHTLPLLYDLYEQHLDRQAQRELLLKEHHP